MVRSSWSRAKDGPGTVACGDIAASPRVRGRQAVRRIRSRDVLAPGHSLIRGWHSVFVGKGWRGRGTGRRGCGAGRRSCADRSSSRRATGSDRCGAHPGPRPRLRARSRDDRHGSSHHSGDGRISRHGGAAAATRAPAADAPAGRRALASPRGGSRVAAEPIPEGDRRGPCRVTAASGAIVPHDARARADPVWHPVITAFLRLEPASG